MPKYLIHMGICGFGNQLLGFKEACIIAKHTNRVIIEPIFIPHGTIRNNCKKYYKFSEIFDVNHFSNTHNSINFKKISHIKINNIYNIRSVAEKGLTDYYYNAQKEYYNLSNVEFNNINNKFITSLNQFQELSSIDDEVLVLLGTFNSIKLNTCNKNGCINTSCKYNETFLNDYNFICESLIFSNNINNITDKVLNDLNLKPNNYCTFHLRTSDFCTNYLFKDCYNNYQESIVYQSIINYLFENNRQELIDKIFVCLPPHSLTIKDLKIFNSKKINILDHTKYDYDSFILSIIELKICQQAQIFIYSPTNTPHMKKEHTRSSFVLQTMDLRRINKQDTNDICIDKIYNKLNIENIKLVNKRNKKIISTSLYGNKDIYNYGLLLNYTLSQKIYTDWILRVYIDNTTNMDFISKIKNNNNIEIIKINTLIGTMIHRFFPISDPDVDIFISRDLDSIVTFYEKNMVNEWINTDKQLHLIHEVLPGHRHLIMGGMFGFKNYTKKINYNENTNKPLSENKIFYYSPWNSNCNVMYKDNNLIISPHNNYNSKSKVLKISNENYDNFYYGKKTICLWDNKHNLPIQKEGTDIKIIHKNRTCYFKCLNCKDYEIFNFYSEIINYYIQNGRNFFRYGDDQNFIKEYLKNYLNKDKCLDHNNTSNQLEYSIKYCKKYTSISTILNNEKDYYVGHRVDTKNLFLNNFSKQN